MDKKTRKELLADLKKLKDNGMSTAEIVDHLNATCVLTSTGKKWTVNRLSSMLSYYRLIPKEDRRPSRKRRRTVAVGQTVDKPKAIKADNAISKSTILAIMSDPHLTRDQAMRMLETYIKN
jgi:hypothetical protein